MKTTLLITGIVAGLALTTLDASAQGMRGDRPDFATLDADGDGLVTLEELQAQGIARFEDVDTDGSGTLSAEEMAAARDARMAERAESRISRVIERLDTDEDGAVSFEELQARGGDRAERMFERADADGDGAISAEEFEEVKERRGGRGHRDGGKGRPGRG